MRTQELTNEASSDPPIQIKIIQKKFTNDLLYNRTSDSFYNYPLTRNESTYLGASPRAETAWNDLLHAQYVAISDAEAKQIPAEHISPMWYDGEHNFMEFAVFHNLHCLYAIRTSLRSMRTEGGSEEQKEAVGWLHSAAWDGDVHLDHCIDQIRQALMCHSDLTPVPMKPLEGKEGVILGNGEMHTCRDFDDVMNWVNQRSNRWKSFGD